MPGARISGLAIAEGIAGFVLFWSGFRNQSLKATLTTLGRGQVPPAIPAPPPSLGVSAGSASPGAAAPGSPGGTTAGSAPGDTGTGAVNGCSAAQTAANKKLGQTLAAAYGWGTGSQWGYLNGVVMLESGWCNTAQNDTSTAYGIGQFLDTTWAGTGYSKTSDPTIQILAMLRYIKDRYKTPQAAYAFHIQNDWY